MDKYKEELIKGGEIAEEFAKLYCKVYGYSFKVPEAEEKKNTGVDCFINNIPTDIKDTRKIVLGNYRTKDNPIAPEKFMGRMPFRKNCKAINYLIVNINPGSNTDFFGVKHFVNIKEYLSNEYFLNAKCYEKALSILYSIDRKSYFDLNFTTISSFLYNLKLKLLPLVRTNIHVKYSDEKNYPFAFEYGIYLIKEEDLEYTQTKKEWYREKKSLLQK